MYFVNRQCSGTKISKIADYCAKEIAATPTPPRGTTSAPGTLGGKCKTNPEGLIPPYCNSSGLKCTNNICVEAAAATSVPGAAASTPTVTANYCYQPDNRSFYGGYFINANTRLNCGVKLDENTTHIVRTEDCSISVEAVNIYVFQRIKYKN